MSRLPALVQCTSWSLPAPSEVRSRASFCSTVDDCESWLHSRLQTQPPQGFALESSSDRLVVRSRVFGQPFLLAVLRAPTSSHTEAEVEEWWPESDRILATVRCPSDLVVLLADTNSGLGSVRSLAVGQFAADEESFSGGCCHAFLLGHALRLPATMPGLGGGEPGTWRSPLRGLHRIDFAGVAQELRELCCCGPGLE